MYGPMTELHQMHFNQKCRCWKRTHQVGNQIASATGRRFVPFSIPSLKRPMQIRATDHPSGSQNFPRPPDFECKSSYKWFLPRTCSNRPSETVKGSRQQFWGFIRCNNRRSVKGNVECLDQAAWLLIPK